jgi:hypothetical protein
VLLRAESFDPEAGGKGPTSHIQQHLLEVQPDLLILRTTFAQNLAAKQMDTNGLVPTKTRGLSQSGRRTPQVSDCY